MHRLLICNREGLSDIRGTFMGNCKRFVSERFLNDRNNLLSLILNVKPPQCNADNENIMVGHICKFIKKMYDVE